MNYKPQDFLYAKYTPILSTTDSVASDDPDDDDTETDYQQSIYLTIFIWVKVLTIMIMMVLGMRAHCKRSERINQVFKLFLYYIFVLILVLMFEFYKPAEESVPLLYIIYVLSGIGQVIQIDFFIKQCK